MMEWTEVAPPTKDSKIPFYGMRWKNAKGRDASNAWSSKAAAEKVERDLAAQGIIVTAKTIRYCGGFAF